MITNSKKMLNINTLSADMSLSPDVKMPPIISALGFVITKFRHPIKFFRFAGEEFKILMDPNTVDPMGYYIQVRNDSAPTYINNFIYALQFLQWERAIIDEDYRERLTSIGKRIRIRSTITVRGVTMPDNLDGYYCSNLMKVRDMINAGRELPMFNSRSGEELFGDIPTFDNEVWTRRYQYLLDLQSEIV